MDLRDQLQQTLGDAYRVERELGGGGMSRVFVAEDRRLTRPVVVKVLLPELAAGLNLERFDREIRVAARLQQANIVPVLSAGDIDGLPYYTMPFVEGESLRSRLARSGPLAPAEAARILIDVARALQFAHDHGVVHRDIKPDNVLLSGETAVVTDFGIAKAISASRAGTNAGDGAADHASALTMLGTSIGTPAYMAPEQAAGDSAVDHRADIYALGCMAYELLTGAPPFAGRTLQRVLAAHLSETPKLITTERPDLPPGLATFVMQCLAKDPAERPANAAAVIRQLEAITSAGTLPAMPAVLRGSFRMALLLYAVAVGVVALVARAAIVAIGLPDWVFGGALIVMALGLPVVLFTGYVQWATRRTFTTTPQLTPGGTQRSPTTLAALALRASPHVSWTRTWVGGALALGVLVLVTAGFMSMRALGVGPAASLFSAGRLTTRDAIIVADFGVSKVDSSIGTVVAEAVRTSLAESRTIRLANPTAIANTLRLMQRSPTSSLDLSVARDIALRDGYKAIVTGDVTALGSGFVVALRLVSADSGALLASFQATVDGPADLIDGVDRLARKLRGKIGESLRAVQNNPPLAQLTTSSVEALRWYAMGTRANNAGDFRGAIDYLRQAVTADSTFAEGWRKLAVAEANAGMPRSAIHVSITQAFRFRERLPTNERLAIEAYYFSSGPGNDRGRGVTLLQELLQRLDGAGISAVATVNLPVGYWSRREFVRAESLFRKYPSPLNASNLAEVLVAQGKWQAAQAAIDTARRRYPAGADMYAIPQLHLYSNTDPDASRGYADSVRRVANRDTRRFTTVFLADLEARAGRVRDARRLRTEVIREDSAAGRLTEAAAVVMAHLDGILLGDHARATHALDSACTDDRWSRMAPADRPYGSYAITYAQLRRPEKARAMLARMEAELRDTALLRAAQPLVHEALAELALVERRADVAISEFRKADMLPDGPIHADPLPILVNLGRAFDVASNADSAIAYFERYLTTPSNGRMADDALYLAGALRRLGELYEAKGDNAKAATYFRHFVELWKNADPELQPVVSDARRRLDRLERTPPK